jgi:hypothetical protein
MSSIVATPWAVFCPEHGRVFLTEQEYWAQWSKPDARWACPMECGPPAVGICGEDSEWDDATYEAAMEGPQ